MVIIQVLVSNMMTITKLSKRENSSVVISGYIDLSREIYYYITIADVTLLSYRVLRFLLPLSSFT